MTVHTTVSKKTILLVEDEILVRNLLLSTIANDDYTLLEANDGDEALDLVRQHHPALVLLDVSMPKRSGFEICHEIKTDPNTSHIHVIILTAHDTTEYREKGESAGADRFFTKPFSPLALLRAIQELLDDE